MKTIEQLVEIWREQRSAIKSMGPIAYAESNIAGIHRSVERPILRGMMPDVKRATRLREEVIDTLIRRLGTAGLDEQDDLLAALYGVGQIHAAQDWLTLKQEGFTATLEYLRAAAYSFH